jgi:hypothetical protein
MNTSSRRLKTDSCQTHQHKTDRLTPDSRQTQTPPDPTIASSAFLLTRVATVRNWFKFFPNRKNGALILSSYYIRSRFHSVAEDRKYRLIDKHFWFVCGRYQVQTSAQSQTNFRGFPQSLQANTRIVSYKRSQMKYDSWWNKTVGLIYLFHCDHFFCIIKPYSLISMVIVRRILRMRLLSGRDTALYIILSIV